jgi:hypothetical protein
VAKSSGQFVKVEEMECTMLETVNRRLMKRKHIQKIQGVLP